MKSNKIFFAVSALALLSSVSLAQAATASLAPAGQGPIDALPSLTSQVSRGQLQAQVAQARLSGQLIPAGQGPIGGQPAVTSVFSRADVKKEVLQARADGELVPAGEGPIDTMVAQHGVGSSYPVAYSARGRNAARVN